MLQAREIGHAFLYLPFIPFPLQYFDPARCKGALPLRHISEGTALLIRNLGTRGGEWSLSCPRHFTWCGQAWVAIQ